MNRNLHKVISLVLCALMILPLALPAAAAGKPTKMMCDDPVIYIAGDSGDIYYENDTKTFRIDDLFSSDSGEDSSDKIWEAVANITLPFILEGIAFDKWDNYYAAVEKEIGDLFAAIRLDGNGNVPEGSDSGIGKEAEKKNAISMTTDRSPGGKYDERAYYFYYDWRLDPNEIADQLNEFINGVCTSTGRERVSLTCKCLGTNIALAYINKYGCDKIKGFGIDVATSKGSEFISGAISGDFGIDGHALARFLKDMEFYYGFSLSPIVGSTIELLANTGVLDTLTNVVREQLYAKIEYGIVSAIATSTFMTFPSYWALVSVEDFEDGLVYAFGEKGSAKREQYAGLIEKITNYNENVKKNIDDIILSTKVPSAKDGKTVNLCIVSKYGTQLVPIVEDGSVLGDTFVSVKHSSFGATTSTVYDTLSDEYIKQRKAENKGKYISPDKKIDASTCLFPEYTWFVKGCKHSTYTPEEIKLILTVIDAKEQLTVNDFDWSQFIIYTPSADDSKGEWGTFSKMTTENCNIEKWEANSELEKPQTKQERIFTLIASLLKWLTTIIVLITELVGTK